MRRHIYCQNERQDPLQVAQDACVCMCVGAANRSSTLKPASVNPHRRSVHLRSACRLARTSASSVMTNTLSKKASMGATRPSAVFKNAATLPLRSTCGGSNTYQRAGSTWRTPMPSERNIWWCWHLHEHPAGSADLTRISGRDACALLAMCSSFHRDVQAGAHIATAWPAVEALHELLAFAPWLLASDRALPTCAAACW